MPAAIDCDSLLAPFRRPHTLEAEFLMVHRLLARCQRLLARSVSEVLTEKGDPPEVVADVLLALEMDSDERSGQIEVEDLGGLLREHLMRFVQIQSQRLKDEASRKRLAQNLPPAPKTLLASRRNRKFYMFDRDHVGSSSGAVFCGPPALVDRAIAGLTARMAEPRLAALVCADVKSPNVFAKTEREDGHPIVTLFAPWWDGAVSKMDPFRKQVETVEDMFKGSVDLLFVGDIARVPEGGPSKGTPVGYVRRAVWVYERLAGMMRQRGGAVVAGLKFKEGEQYAGSDMIELGEKCYRYDLYVDGTLLYAEDVLGNKHLIVENNGATEITCSTSTTSSGSIP